MTATNHALTGALIGFTVHDPFLAITLAIVSHFVLDALPHFAMSDDSKSLLKARIFKVMLIIEALLCLVIVSVLAIYHPTHWLLAAVCAFLATSPDFLHINQFYRSLRNEPWKPNLYSRFAAKIQWFEHPSGAVVEVVWFLAMLFCLRLFI